jgi:hypothetical protein
MSATKFDRIGLGAFEGPPTYAEGAATLGTSPIKVALPAPPDGRPRDYLVRLANPNAANNIAWTLVAKGAAAPTVTATVGANVGNIVFSKIVEPILIPFGVDLYLVADAAAQSYALNAWLFS